MIFFVCLYLFYRTVCVCGFLFSSFVDVFSIMIITIIILSTLSLSHHTALGR